MERELIHKVAVLLSEHGFVSTKSPNLIAMEINNLISGATWKSIKSAPRDGTIIYVVDIENDNQGRLSYNSGMGAWEEVNRQGEPQGIGFYPTHYFDIPEPPTTNQGSNP